MIHSRQFAYINPKILKWAREQSGLTLNEAAGSKISLIKLEKAELGQEKLTFNQLKFLARKYRRPIGFFYLNAPPNEIDLIEDFRTINSTQVKYSPLLRDEIIRIKEKRELAIKFQDYDKKYDYSWINKISPNKNPERMAEEILKLLDMTVDLRKKCKTSYDAFNTWKKTIELKGILIFQLLKIPITEMRGFSIADTPFPVIVLNRSDSPLGRLFTLLHEFVHILIKRGGICTINEMELSHFETERFCNAVAGATLVPKKLLITHQIVQEHKTDKIWSHEELNSLKNYFWASKEVILRRLLDMHLTSKEFYQQKRAEWQSLPAKKGGGPERPPRRVLLTNSHNFIKIVLNAMYDEQISMSDVSYYLNMSLKHLNELENELEGLKSHKLV